MDKILQQQFLDNTLELYLMVGATILVALFFKRIISKYLARLIYNLAIAKASRNIGRESFLNLVVAPLDTFLVLLIAFISLDKLTFPHQLEFRVYKITSKELADALAAGTIIIVFIWLCLRIIDFIALVLEEKVNRTTDMRDNQLIVFFKDFFKVILIIIGIMLILKTVFRQDVSSLLTGLSLVGAAIALATKESMENLIASFIIFFDKPFTTGDLVRVNGFTGNIEKIGLRSTRIRTADKTYISVPNKQMVDTIVDNISLRTQRKVELRLELSLGATAQQLKTVIPAIKKCLEKPEIEAKAVFLMDTGRTAHIMAVDYFTSMDQTVEAFNNLREQVNLDIIETLEVNHIEPAAGSTSITLSQPPPPKQA
ncbi:mechanosensitive ion channel family protein [Sediminibacterium ginsengisoli]|uniref:MscS family membrane protein n=1 Tax=Sediminibacterium ginsengisoli TaxID=413434 RepID=A0A1T4M5D0_9BACT|nr:mechanosensitive ion channel domain-containing protein [Sediminibacterium ginsengisoli]SJZ62132.1 MscS family membrane protein [Sediminibacterium ginsengisoli]